MTGIVRVYTGGGTTRTGAEIVLNEFRDFLRPVGMAVEPISHDEIKSPQAAWMKDTKLLIIPGGNASGFRAHLGEAGMEAIRSWVNGGGQYLGICAGGYFGAAEIDFRGAAFHKKARGLGFFNGLAHGSLTQIAPKPFTGLSDSAALAKVVMHGREDIVTDSYYCGGPGFKPANDDYRALAHFKTAKEDILGGVQVDVGRGRATLLGFHAEVTGKRLKAWMLASGESEKAYMHIPAQLTQRETSRKIGFAALLDALAIVPGHNFVRQVRNEIAQNTRRARQRMPLLKFGRAMS